MHYDHVGNHTLFPNARYHLQDKEMIYATGRYMCHPAMRYPFYPEDVAAMVHRVFAGKVVFHDGVDEIAPGLSVHHVGGHTMGLQVVRAWTRRGWVVLASDASHLYANMNQGRPVPGGVQRRRHAGGSQALSAARGLAGARHPGARSAGAEALSGAASGAGGDCRAARCRSAAAVISLGAGHRGHREHREDRGAILPPRRLTSTLILGHVISYNQARAHRQRSACHRPQPS